MRKNKTFDDFKNLFNEEVYEIKNLLKGEHNEL